MNQTEKPTEDNIFRVKATGVCWHYLFQDAGGCHYLKRGVYISDPIPDHIFNEYYEKSV